MLGLGLRRRHPGHLLVPGPGQRIEPDPGRADRCVGDPVRRAVRRPRSQRRGPPTALVGSLAALLVTAALGWVATRWAHLTGITAEDDYVLVASAPDLLLSSVVMCGIILAGVGVLIDVTTHPGVGRVAAADTEPSARRLFAKAMRTGREHAAANVSTIAFVTVGAALPVLLLLVVYTAPAARDAADRAVRRRTRPDPGRLHGVVLAIPLTTAIAVALGQTEPGGAETAEDQTRAATAPAPSDADRGDPPAAPVAPRQGRVRGHRRLLRPARAGRGAPPTAPALLIPA